jgi:repressor LexA
VLTLAQRKTYDFIKDFFSENHYSPTSGEIAKGIGIASRGVVYRHLKALAAEKKIALTPKRHRNICLLEGAEGVCTIPLLGEIAAGQPIQAIAQQESIDVASVFLGVNRFALKVRGDSMIDEGIFDGDIVVCEKSGTARDGQIVVALVDREEATLKRLKRGKHARIILEPANSSHRPMEFSAGRVEIQGIYIGLLRFTG